MIWYWTKYKILELHEQHVPASEIAKRCGVTVETVYKVIEGASTTNGP